MKKVTQLLTEADKLIGEAMRAAKSALAREDLKDAQFKLDDALTHEEQETQDKPKACERTQVTVRKQAGSRRFGVYRNGDLIEGGFFSRIAAENCAYRAERSTVHDVNETTGHTELSRIENTKLSDGSEVWDVVGIDDRVFCRDMKSAIELHCAIQAAIAKAEGNGL